MHGGVILAHIYVRLYLSCKEYGSGYLQSCQIASRCRLRLVAPACARLLHSKTAAALESAWKWSAPSRYTSPLSLIMTQNKSLSTRITSVLLLTWQKAIFYLYSHLFDIRLRFMTQNIRYLLSRPPFFNHNHFPVKQTTTYYDYYYYYYYYYKC